MSPLAIRQRIAELYELLYVDKYSRLNPQYTAAFIGAAQQSGLLTFHLLEHVPPTAAPHQPESPRDATTAREAAAIRNPATPSMAGGLAGASEPLGRIDGVAGVSVAHGYLAAPVLGYDTGLPQSVGLYRMLSYAIAALAHDAGVDLHNSSGVADFKRHRGAEPELEYLAVYTRHLPWHRRAGWAVLAAAVRLVAAPLVQRQGL